MMIVADTARSVHFNLKISIGELYLQISTVIDTATKSGTVIELNSQAEISIRLPRWIKDKSIAAAAEASSSIPNQ